MSASPQLAPSAPDVPSKPTRWSLATYLCERFPPWPFFPLAALLAAPGVLSDAHAGGLGVASWLRIALSLLLLLSLRLADDLADRGRDEREHPTRHTVRADPSRAWRALQALALAGVAGLAVLPQAPLRVSCLLVLAGLLAAWYRWRPDRSEPRLLNALVVLLKYPALVALLWPAREGAPLMGALALSYGGALGYELAHDPRTRPSQVPWFALSVAASLALVVGGVAWGVIA